MWDSRKTSNSKIEKVDMCSTFKTWRIPNNHRNVDRTISLFHFFVLPACELTICIATLFLFVYKVMHAVWKGVCCFHFVCSKSKIDSPYQLHMCKNSKMWMLHCALYPLQMICIQIQIHGISHCFPIGN
jgi:hypothetical protein